MTDLERQVDEQLAPLKTIASARRVDGRGRRGREFVYASLVTAALLVLAIGATYLTIELTASPQPAPVSEHGSLACLDLVGGSAGHAETVLRQSGYEIKWRFETFDPPDGKTFTTTTPATVPTDAVVEDVESGGDGAVLVFVHAVDDAYAPSPTPPPCIS
jgi:hypothetical protein